MMMMDSSNTKPQRSSSRKQKSAEKAEGDDWSPSEKTKKPKRGQKTKEQTPAKKGDSSAYEYFGGAPATVVSTTFSSSNWLPTSLIQPLSSSASSNSSTQITVIDDCSGSPPPQVLQLSASSIISAAVVSGTTTTSSTTDRNGNKQHTTTSTTCLIFKPTTHTQSSVSQTREREKAVISGIAASFYSMIKSPPPPSSIASIASPPAPQQEKKETPKHKGTPLTFSTDLPENIDFEKLLGIPPTPSLTKSVDEPLPTPSTPSVPPQEPNPFFVAGSASALAPITPGIIASAAPPVTVTPPTAPKSRSRSKKNAAEPSAAEDANYKPFTFTFSGKYTFG